MLLLNSWFICNNVIGRIFILHVKGWVFNMGYYLTIILIVIGFLCQKKHHTWICPESLFCYEWSIISFLASLRLFGLYEVGIKTWCIIGLGSISFVLGSGFGEKIKDGKKHSRYNEGVDIKVMNPKTFWVLILFIGLYYSFDLVESIKYMRQGITLGDIREASYGMNSIEGFNRKTGMFWEYLSLFVGVSELIVVAYGIYLFFSDTRNNYSCLIIVLLVETMKAFSNGGRFCLAYLIIELIVCLNIFNQNSEHKMKLSSKVTRVIIRAISILLLLIIVVTLIRGANSNELIKKYYRYLCGDVVFFDLHVKEISFSSLWSFPFAGLYGLWSVILPILNGLGMSYPNAYVSTINEYMDTQMFRQIGDGMYTNAFITPFYHLYADFRLLGVLIGMFLFGLVSGLFYKKVVKCKNSYSIVCYLYVSQMIFKSLQIYPFANKTYIFTLIVLLVIGAFNRKTLYYCEKLDNCSIMK